MWRDGFNNPKVAGACNMLPATRVVLAKCDIVASGERHLGKLWRESRAAEFASKLQPLWRLLQSCRCVTGLHVRSLRGKMILFRAMSKWYHALLGRAPPIGVSRKEYISPFEVSNVPYGLLSECPLHTGYPTYLLKLRRFPVPQVAPAHCAALRFALASRAGLYHIPGTLRGTCLYEPNYLSLLPRQVFEKIEAYCGEPAELRTLKRGFGAWMRKN